MLLCNFFLDSWNFKSIMLLNKIIKIKENEIKRRRRILSSNCFNSIIYEFVTSIISYPISISILKLVFFSSFLHWQRIFGLVLIKMKSYFLQYLKPNFTFSCFSLSLSFVILKLIILLFFLLVFQYYESLKKLCFVFYLFILI